jgi:hypothetical protein
MTWTGGMPLGMFEGVRTYTLDPLDDGTTIFTMQEGYSGWPAQTTTKQHARPHRVLRAVRDRTRDES